MWEESYNRAMKGAMRKNNVEQTVYRNTSRSIDAERRSLATRRIREEGELRAKLQRLQLEQRLCCESDNTGSHR